MYVEENSEKNILKRMKDNVPPSVDKLEGSFIHDALYPFSKELEKAYVENNNILVRTNPYTAVGEDLEKIINPYGIFRKNGQKAVGKLLIKGVIGTTLKSGTLVQTKGGLKYKIIEDMVLNDETVLISIEALEVGSNYNVPSNVITELPMQINGVISITNPNPIVNGYDVEDDESLRQRYFERLQTPATSGNKYHYKNWAKEVAGVGDAKVFPLWNGNGTVKIVIIDSNKKSTSKDLINAVFKHIEEERPIGVAVTVISGIEKTIDISVNLIIDTKKYTLNSIQTTLENSFKQYFNKIAFVNNYVSYASIGNIIFNTSGVIDYINLLINGEAKNIPLQDEEIPVFGALKLEV